MVDRVPTHVTPEYRVQEADYIHDEIVAQASAIPADLLVLGTHGCTGLAPLSMGNVTACIV
jgi:nucleotide-binding universal stress UspA family protein